MKNKILSFGVLLIAWIMVMAPPTSAQSDTQSLKTNSTTVRTHSQQLPAAYNSSSWTIVNERTNGEGATTITGVDSGSFIIPNTSTASAPEGTQATVVYDNGPHINVAGTPDLSVLESVTLNMNTLGGNVSNSSGYGMADDFELVAETEITGITVYAYQTGATSTTINGMYVTIWDGDPSGGGSIVWGDQTTDVFDSVEDINAYRVAENDQGGRTRMIQKVNASISGLTLAAGTYWLEYSLNGTASSGPWQPPIVILGETTTGNALQVTPTGYQAWLDSGTSTPQGLPFQIEGMEAVGATYCIAEGTNSGRYIDNFSTTGGSQDISSMGCGFSSGGYGDFYDTHTVEHAVGEDVAFDVDIAGRTAGFRIGVGGNQDGVFDTTEEVAWNSSGYLTNHTGSFTVPADALEGDTRMRIVSHWLSTTGDVDPCETGFTYGEFEDYKFTVSGGGGGGQVYCEPAGTNSSYYIDSFSTTGATTNISNLGSGFSPGGYGDFYDTHTVAQAAGEDVEFLAEFPTGQTYGFRIWVDWNQDGVFDTTEEVAWNSSSYGNPQSGSFTVPADAMEGETRMRIVGHWLNSSGNIDPCSTSHNYGEFEDYKFTVEGSGGAGCEWTVIVEDTSWGDEVEWELREDGGGNILLSGGGYGNGYYDEQTVTAEGPLEFWITNDGFFGDNTPTYSVSNGTEVLVSGTLTTAETLTFSDLNCDSGGGDPCDAVDVPYVQDFETATPPDMPECTTVVNAGSGNNWKTSTDEYGDFTGTFLEYEYHASAPANSWFFTQGINLEAGTDYEITYGYGSRAAAAFPENLKVAFGDDNDPDAMTNLIAEHVAILSGGDKIMNTVEFTATTSGVFYFGFQAFSGANEWYLYLDDIEIKEADGSPGGDDCGQGDDSNGFENGYNITAGGTFRNADDFIVSAGNTLNVRSIVLNVFANEPVSSVNINFFEDGGGMPGSTIVESVSGLVPYAQVPIGSNFGYTIYGVYLEVDLNFAGGASGASYWMQPEAVTDVAFWEVTSLGSLGELIHTSEAMGPWMPDEDGVNHAVFKLHCEVVTAPDPGCLFDITASVEPITRVVLAGIDNTSSAVVNGSPALEDFTHIEGTMGQGTEYDIALEGNTDGNWTNYFTVWIDWDQNGVWEADEMYEIGSITNSTGTDGQQATGTITVPADAPLGSTTMRVIKSFGSSPTDPCGQYSFGQGEDYTIIVEEGVGIDDQSMTTFTYYPNPTSGIVNITANKDISSVSVVNILGQQVIATKSLDNGQVDLSALATGTYMFRVTFEDGSLETFKVLKE